METKVYFKNSKRERLCGILNTPSQSSKTPIVIFVHGYSSNKNTKNFVRLKNVLAKNNVASFRFDIHGHGESEGKFEETTVSEAVDDILQAIQFVKDKGYKKIGLIGSSFGGIASIMAASKTKNLILLALKSPVSNFADIYMRRGISIKEWRKKGYLDYSSKKMGKSKLHYSFYQDALKNDGRKATSKIKIPTLIVHGDQDETVPVEQSLKISSLIPDCQLVLVKGADHRYTKPEHARKMRKAISEFITRNIKVKYSLS